MEMSNGWKLQPKFLSIRNVPCCFTKITVIYKVNSEPTTTFYKAYNQYCNNILADERSYIQIFRYGDIENAAVTRTANSKASSSRLLRNY